MSGLCPPIYSQSRQGPMHRYLSPPDRPLGIGVYRLGVGGQAPILITTYIEMPVVVVLDKLNL